MRASRTLLVGGWLFAGAPVARADDAPKPTPVAEKTVPAAALVVAAITKAAVENAARPLKTRATGDALADLYVRRAAVAAAGDIRAFTVGLVKAFDPSDTLGKFSLTARSFRNLETADEAKVRRAAIGEPTLRGRNDRLLHFVVSAAITNLLGEGPARTAGLAKELADMKGGSGFSIGDWLADLAGIVFARRLSEGAPATNLAWTAEAFTGVAVVPDDAGLSDSLTQAEFEKAYGGVADARFTRMCEKLLASIEALPYLRASVDAPAPVSPDGRRDPSPTK